MNQNGINNNNNNNVDFRKMIESANQQRHLAAIEEKASGAAVVRCCEQDMIVHDQSYRCARCNKIYTFERAKVATGTNVARACVKITNKSSSRATYYNMTGGNVANQLQTIRKKLADLAKVAPGPPIAPSILEVAAQQYNDIQQITIGDKKEIKRGDMQNEILAFLIYNECMGQVGDRKRKDIARFMQLPAGFSRGETEVRRYVTNGQLNIKIHTESARGYTERYLEVLATTCPEINNAENLDLILQIIARSEQQHLKTNSLISSKVVGTIWFVIVKRNYNITAEDLEVAADKTKKHTFQQFYKCIIENRAVFGDIFAQYGL